MRVCRHCQHINGDSETYCRRCGGEIASQITLPADTPIPRTVPDVLARRNRRALLLVLLLPAIVAINVFFWADVVPGFVSQADQARAQRLQANQHLIETALARCQADTGGLPVRGLDTLTHSRVTAADLTAGANPHQWRGPYLPVPIPANPYHPNDGTHGWRYTIHNGAAIVQPAHMSP